MSTYSIFHTVRLTTATEAEAFVNALEESERATRDEVLTSSYKFVTDPDEIRALFSKKEKSKSCLREDSDKEMDYFEAIERDRLRSAKRMIEDGLLDDDHIAEYSSLPKYKIEELRNDHKERCVPEEH